MDDDHLGGEAAFGRTTSWGRGWDRHDPHRSGHDGAGHDGAWHDDAEEPDDGFEDASAYATAPAAGSGLLERAAGALGALTSVALVAGLGAWTWDLARRDLSEVPVVRAIEGPARMAPADPGGDVAENQGLAVNAIQAARDEEAAPERVVLAPREQDLAADDTAAAEPWPLRSERATARPLGIGPRPGTPVLLLASADTGVAVLPAVAGSRASASGRAWAGAAIDAQPEAVDPIEAALAEALGRPAPEAEAADGAAASVAADGSVTRSPRPSVRPETAPAPDGLVPAALTAPEIPAAAIPAGTQLVQLGAFASESEARVEWADLTARLGPYLEGKAPVVQRASSTGRTFYRLRAAGFSDQAEAERHCAALVADGVDCVPVTVR